MIGQDLLYNFSSAAYLTLASILLFGVLWYLKIYRKKALENFVDSDLLPKLTTQRSNTVFWTKVLFICSAWILACLAFMQPKGNSRYPETGHRPLPQTEEQNVSAKRKAQEVIILIDASASMGITDARSGETRLAFAKEIVDEILGQLSGEEVSLYAFTSDVTKMVPPTMDYLFARIILRQIHVNEGGIPGTDIIKALTYIRDHYLTHPTDKLKTLILMSDGGDTELETLQGSAKEQQIQMAVELLVGGEAAHLQVFTAGIGSKSPSVVPEVTFGGQPVHSHLDEDLLKKLSEYGHGHYYFANDYSAMNLAQDLAKQIEQRETEGGFSAIEKHEPKKKEELIYDLYFQFPLGLAILLLSFVLLFPDAKRQKKSLLSGTIKCFLLLLSPQFVFSSEGDLLLQHASYFAEAGDHSLAQELYVQLLQTDLTSYQRDVVLYNKATQFLEANDLEKAITSFREIVLNQNSSPLLLQRVETNKAIALFRQAKALLENIDKQSSVVDGYSKAIYLFHEALKSVAEAEKASCLLDTIEGSHACGISPDLERLRVQIKVNLSKALQNLTHFQIIHTPFREGIPLLLVSVDTALMDIGVLKQHKPYLYFFLDEMKSWFPFWKAMNTNAKDLKTDAAEKFNAAWTAYAQGFALLQKGDFEVAEHALKISADSLKELIRLLWGDGSVQETLQKLLGFYEKTLLQDPLYEVALGALKNETNQVKNVNLKDVNQYTDLAIKEVRQGNQQSAHLYLQEAQQRIKRLLRELEKKEMTPVTILSNTIDEQKHALTSARYLQQIVNKDHKEFDPIEEIVSNSQKEVLLTAAPFLESVYIQQKREFPKRCQKKPWDEVLPLFEKGIQAANKASQILSKRVNEGMTKQEEALKLWNVALSKLQHQQKEQPREAQPPTQEKQAKQSSVDSVLQLLQEMENDDQMPPKIIAPKEVSRPW